MPQSSMTQCRSANRKYLVLFTFSSYKPLEISGPNMPKLLATTTLNTAVNSINCLHKHPHNGTHTDTYAQIMTVTYMYSTEAHNHLHSPY